jgi:CubicO group peptidase (beta-lactamase class C family)
MKMLGMVLLVLTLSLGSLVYGDSRTDQVDSLFEEWNKPDSPGCALGIIEDGRFLYKKGYGMANLEYDIPISSSTVFRTGSVSKQFTVMCIMLAASEGKLSLDDDIRKHLPEMPAYEKTVTIRNLIHHTSGIRDYLVLMRLAGKRDEDYYTDEEVMEKLAALENLNFTPGDEYLYSNAGFWLLSQIIERATGKTLRDWADEKLFKPLGMTSTHFHDDPRMIVKNRASGYRKKQGGGFEIDMTPLEMVGDGGVFTTIDDLLKWDRNFDDMRVGGESVMKEMLKLEKLNDGTLQSYAGGLVLTRHKGLNTVQHGGAFVGFRAGMMRFPEEKFSAYCLCNFGEAEPEELIAKSLEIYLEGKLQAEEVVTTTLSETAMKKRVGNYWSPRLASFATLRFENGGLIFRTDETPHGLLPINETDFVLMRYGSRSDIVFLDDQGSPNRFEMQSEGQRTFEYKKVEKVSPSTEDLKAFEGSFYCRELDATYRIRLGEEGQLIAKVEHFPDQTLLPVFQDGFRWESGSVVFERSASGKIEGFRLSAGRARNFQFERKPEK